MIGRLTALLVAFWAGSVAAQPRPEPVEAESPDWTGLSTWVGAGREVKLDLHTGPLDLKALTPRASVALIGLESAPPVEDLLRFVREGGRLLVADEGPAAAPLWEGLGLRQVPAPRARDGEDSLPGHPGFHVLQPPQRGLFAGVPRLVTNHPVAFSPSALTPAVTFPDGTPFAYHVALGNGEVLALADASLFINLMQSVPENARLAANVLGWLSGEDGQRPVHLLAGIDTAAGRYEGVAPPDEQLGGAAAFNRAVGKLASAHLDDPALRFFVALLLAAACIYALGVYPGFPGRQRPAGPRLPPPPDPRNPEA